MQPQPVVPPRAASDAPFSGRYPQQAGDGNIGPGHAIPRREHSLVRPNAICSRAVRQPRNGGRPTRSPFTRGVSSRPRRVPRVRRVAAPPPQHLNGVIQSSRLGWPPASQKTGILGRIQSVVAITEGPESRLRGATMYSIQMSPDATNSPRCEGVRRWTVPRNVLGE